MTVHRPGYHIDMGEWMLGTQWLNASLSAIHLGPLCVYVHHPMKRIVYTNHLVWRGANFARRIYMMENPHTFILGMKVNWPRGPHGRFFTMAVYLGFLSLTGVWDRHADHSHRAPNPGLLNRR